MKTKFINILCGLPLVGMATIPLVSCNEPEGASHHFSFVGTNCTINGQNKYSHDIYEKDKNVQYTIVPDNEFKLPEDIGSKDVQYDKETGVITISEIKSDITINVQAIPSPTGKTYAVSFNAMGGEVTSANPVEVEGGKTVAKPTLADRPGYDETQVKWVDKGGKEFEFEKTAITDNIVLYAQWGAIENFEVDFYVTTEVIEKKNVNYGEKPIYYTPKNGSHQFLGWYTNDSLTVPYDFSKTITQAGTKIYAKWDEQPEPPLIDASVSMLVSVEENETISFDCTYSNDFTVYWGDGATDTNQTHKYVTPGWYNIQIVGKLDTFAYTSANKASILKADLDEVVQINENAFSGCANLSEVVIGGDTTTISQSAFYSCGLTSIVIPSTVLLVGENAFNHCASLETVSLENSPLKIEKSTFRECYSLKSITIPNSVTSIGDYAFYSCVSLIAINFGAKLQTIGEHAFENCISFADQPKLPTSIVEIGAYSFKNCFKMGGFAPYEYNNLTKINDSAFENCTSFIIGDLTSSSLTYIGKYAFARTQSSYFRANSMPSLETIGDYAFWECQLSDIVLNKNLKYIGNKSFNNSYMCGLANVDATRISDSSKIPTLGMNVFDNRLQTFCIYVCSNEMIETFEAAPGWSQYTGRYRLSPFSTI